MTYPGVPTPLVETLLASIPAYLFLLRRPDLSLLWVTEGVIWLTGFESRDLIARPGLFAECIHPEDRDRIRGLCGTLAAGPPVLEDVRFRCADGKTRRFRMGLEPSAGPPGDPSAVAGIAWSVEEARSVGREARLRQGLLLAADAPLVFVDMSGTIRLWNGAAERFFGWAQEEMVGKGLQALFPVPPKAVSGLLRRVREEGSVRRDDRLATRGGTSISCRLTLSLVRDEEGHPEGMILTVAGTSEFRSLEKRLQELITRLRISETVNRIVVSEWDIKKIYGRIAPELSKLVDYDRTSIAVFDEGKDRVLIRTYIMGGADAVSTIRVPLERSASGWVRARRVPRIDEDLAESEEQFVENSVLIREGMRSRLVIPLFAGERIVGALSFKNRKKEMYSLATVEELGSIPDQLALAIDKYRAYAQLKGSEQRYRMLFEQGAPAAIARADGRYVDVNPGCLRLFGYTREEFLRLTHRDLAAHPEASPQPAEILESGIAQDRELLVRRKDGNVFWGHLVVFPVSKDLVLGQITDITPRKDAEEALRREKEYSSSILSVANALIIVLGHDGRILLFNRKCEEVTGWTEKEMRGKHLWDGLLPNRYVTPIKEEFSRLPERDLASSYEIPWQNRDGKERLISWSNAVVRGEKGEVVWVIGTGIDITEHRELEARVRQIQKMEAVGTLAGGIAHDFNNIIQAILGHASLLKSRIGEQAEASVQIDAIEQASLRAANLTRQLLGFARGGKYEVRATDVNGVVEKVVSMIRPTFDRSIDIRTKLQADLHTVEADAGQLEHSLLNLFINSRDAMPEGGTLLIETRNETLPGPGGETPIRLAPGAYINLTVSDTGVGIPSETLPRIFEPFFTTKEPGKGTGMGLAMVYGIVKNHGGWVDVHSVPGRGTAFRILLPASPEKPTVLPAPSPPEPLAEGTETILFVDDEETLCALAEDLLGSLGYTVITAQNGIEAIYRFTENRAEIDLVILDLVMPEMGGAETFRRIRQMDPSARVLLSSGYAVEGRPEALIAAGAAGFIQKPYRLPDLAAAVRKVLSR